MGFAVGSRDIVVLFRGRRLRVLKVFYPNQHGSAANLSQMG
jgi:hypothetical protein